jgi:hypothetical protein
MAKIHGYGLMWIPAWGKAVQFNDSGIIETNDPTIIDCAELNGFSVEGIQTSFPEIEAPRRGRKPKAVEDEDN